MRTYAYVRKAQNTLTKCPHEKKIYIYIVNMQCLHGPPAASSTTKNGSFWFCDQKPSCNFICSFGQNNNETELYKKAICTWQATNLAQPRCPAHGKLAKLCVVKDLLKINYGRPFFVCPEKQNPCPFWEWGDVPPLKKPMCHHSFACAVRKVKKECQNKGQLFFCCPNGREHSCQYFEWVPETKPENKSFPTTTLFCGPTNF